MVPPKMEDASGWRRSIQTGLGGAVLENYSVPPNERKDPFGVITLPSLKLT